MTITTPPIGVERRVGQRFAFNLPVSLRDVSSGTEGLGFTQDLSSRGAFLFTVMALSEGSEIELTLKMPSEITLGESMRVRCRGRVLRIFNAADNGWKPASMAHTETKLVQNGSDENKSAATRSGGTKIGVAVCLKGSEYPPETRARPPSFPPTPAPPSASHT